MDNADFPYVPPTLLEALERLYPERSPHIGEAERTMLWRGGQCDVVRFLRAHFEQQNKNILAPKGPYHVQT